MLLSFLGLVASLLGVGILFFCWRYKHRYFGTDNRHRWFAEFFKDFPVFHNAKTLHMKKKLFESLHDIGKNGKRVRILEIGAGPGANLQFYPKNTQLTVVDPNPYFKKQLAENIDQYADNVTLERYVVTGAEDMKDIENNSVDAVVSTLVLCSCDKVRDVYKEICRVLVPGGKFYYMEHVLDDKPFSIIKLLQVLGSVLGVYQFLFDGCRTDKDLEKELREANFVSVDAKRFRLDLSEGVPLLYTSVYMIIPHLYGTATTPESL